MTTAFGPQGPNYTLTRPPADPQASAGADTFFKNCSAAGAKDGTFATADFFNVNIGNLRYIVRQAGVTLDDATDTMLYNAVEAMINEAIGNIPPPNGGPTVPVGNPTIWVRTDGNDTNDGTSNDSAHAMATIQAALLKATTQWILGGKVLTIQLGNIGTYAQFNAGPQMGFVTILGDPANQANFVVQGNGAGASAVVQATGCNLTLRGLTVRNSGTTENTVAASSSGAVNLDQVTIGASVTNNPNAAVVAFPGSTVNISGSTTITFNANMGMSLWAEAGQITVSNGVTINYVGGPAYSTATVSADTCGSVVFSGVTINGAVTGKRFSADANAVIKTFGAGASFVPGTVAGTTTNGGIYI